jgi:hypothetical protein
MATYSQTKMQIWFAKPDGFDKIQTSVIIDTVVSASRYKNVTEITTSDDYVQLVFPVTPAYGDYYDVSSFRDVHTVSIDCEPPEVGTICIECSFDKDKYIDRTSQYRIHDSIVFAVGNVVEFQFITLDTDRDWNGFKARPRADVLAALRDPSLRTNRPLKPDARW